MEITERKNKHGYMVIDCPACGDEIYSKMLQRHVSGCARREGMIKAIGSSTPVPHFDFYVEHTEPVVTTKRKWKGDIKIIQ